MLIFLDIDGVMVPAKGWKSPELLDDGFPAFSNRAISVLKSLLSQDATIMLTTSHKANYTIAAWKEIFMKRGINAEKIKTLNDNTDNLSRKDEIINWFNANTINENFVIIDDDKSLNSLPNNLKGRLILTSPFVGLTEDDLQRAQERMHEDLKPAVV